MPPITRRKLLLTGAASAAGAAAGSYGYGRLLERHWIEVVRKPVLLGLPRPLKIAVAGDIHIDPLHEWEYTERWIKKLTGLEVDMAVLTGDFVSHDDSHMPDLTKLLSRIAPPMGAYAVLGNHDHWTAPREIARELTRNGICVLANESIPLPGCPGWFLSGLESYWGGKPDPAALDLHDPDARHILLVHEPEAFDRLPHPQFKLQVSGHSHGGQVRIPLGGPLILPRLGRRYHTGLYEIGDRKIYVNRGIGTLGPHVRFSCRPEITMLELT